MPGFPRQASWRIATAGRPLDDRAGKPRYKHKTLLCLCSEQGSESVGAARQRTGSPASRRTRGSECFSSGNHNHWTGRLVASIDSRLSEVLCDRAPTVRQDQNPCVLCGRVDTYYAHCSLHLWKRCGVRRAGLCTCPTNVQRTRAEGEGQRSRGGTVRHQDGHDDRDAPVSRAAGTQYIVSSRARGLPSAALAEQLH